MVSVNLNGLITTPVFGGQEGELYNDVYCASTTKDTSGFLVKDSGYMKAISKDHPITKIVVNVDGTVRGMTVTYRVATSGFQTVSFQRGNETVQRFSVDVRETEMVLAVFGRAGQLSRYDPDRQVVHSIGFILFDTKTGLIRTCGPYGNASLPFGEPFHVTNVVGFGGFHSQTSDIGLSGLFFIKDMAML